MLAGLILHRAGDGRLWAFLILAAQYGKWTLPFSVILAVPLGMFGALVAIFFVPFFYKLVMERKLGEKRSSEELKQEATHHREIQQHRTAHASTRTTHHSEGSDD